MSYGFPPSGNLSFRHVRRVLLLKSIAEPAHGREITRLCWFRFDLPSQPRNELLDALVGHRAVELWPDGFRELVLPNELATLAVHESESLKLLRRHLYPHAAN